jgi:hypothetical protein
MHSHDSSEPTGIKGELSGGHTVKGNFVGRNRNDKAAAVVAMRVGGATWPEVCLALGYPTPRTAMMAFEKALIKQLANPEDRKQLRALAGARLDRLLRSVWPKAINPDHPDHLLALTKAREIVAQQSKLYGLDAPTEIVVHSPTQNEIDEWVGLMLTAQGPRLVNADIIDVEADDVPA